MSNTSQRVFLFLQGPISPFFRQIADGLENKGHKVLRINLCFGDWLFWQRKGASNYRGHLSNWPIYINLYLDKEKVTDIVLIGEQREYHKLAIAAAKQRNIQIITTDFGYLRPDWITLELNGMSGNSLFPKDPVAIKSLAAQTPEPNISQQFTDNFITQVFWDMSYHLSSILLHVLFPFYRSHQIYHPISVYLGTGLHLLATKFNKSKNQAVIDQLITNNTAYFLFPLQMQNDFQIRFYSKYPNLEAAIDEVISSFANHASADNVLVVKVHPLDPFLINWEKYCRIIASEHGISDRVLYIDGGALNPLIEKARGVVTINSTVGIWTLLLGRPLITLGSAIYNIKGLTNFNSLNAFWQNPIAPDLSLRDAFIKALTSTIQLRGVFYHKPGLEAAVAEAINRLHQNQINKVLS